MARTTILPATIEQRLENWCAEHFVEFIADLPADNVPDKTVRSYRATWDRPQGQGPVHITGNRYTINITVNETRTDPYEQVRFSLYVDGGQRFEGGNNYLLQYRTEKRSTSYENAVFVLEAFYAKANALTKSDFQKTSVPFFRG